MLRRVSSIEPWHLPGFEEPPARGEREGRTPSGATFRAPRLDAAAARGVASTVRRAALEARRERSVEEVVAAVSRAARSLTDGSGEAGREATALLRAELGWPEELARETLEGMAAGWGEEPLRALLRRELGDPGVLDGWVEAPPAPGGRTRRRRASGPPLLFVAHAGNVPGVAVTAALRGLLVRSGVLCKAPSSEPGLLALFARELAREDPLLGRCLAVNWWPGGTTSPEVRAWTGAAGEVVLYGGPEAVDAYRSRLPAEVDLLVYGPRVGLGVVLGDAADRGAGARALARDVCAYEQAGCVSPRVVYVVGADPGPWAEALARALEEETRRTSPPAPSPGEAVAIRSVRAEAGFRGHAGDGAAPEVLGDREGLAWTVLVGGDPAPRTEGLPRVVRVHAVEAVRDLEPLLAPLEGRIQALGHAGREDLDELADLAHRLGVARVAPFGEVAWPPPDWRHDGRHQILPLVRWTDRED